MITNLVREFGQLCLDVVISLMLFVVAGTFASVMQKFVTPNLNWFYIFWFSIGMLPCAFYMRYRGVLKFDRWDFVAFSPVPFLLSLLRILVPGPFVQFVGGLALMAVAGYVRGLLPKGERE